MAKKIPAFSYTGAYRTQSDGNYWYILLLTSGTLTLQYAKSGVDVGCVGGGGSSACHLQKANPAGGSGGGGGYIATGTAAIAAGQGYAVSIGEGGAVPVAWHPGNDGGATSAFGIIAQGGKGAGTPGWKESGTPGAGTGAGGTGGKDMHIAGTQGENGQDLFGLGLYGAGGGGGGGGWAAGGSGGADGGGAGGAGGSPGYDGANGTAGTANTGGGAGGPGGGYVDEDSRYNRKGGQAAAGGSGVVILRGTQDDLIPAVFNGTQLSELYFNGVKVTSLIFNGTKLFARRMFGEVERCLA